MPLAAPPTASAPRIWLALPLVLLGACGGKEGLALVQVEIAPEVAAFKQVRFSVPARANVGERVVARADRTSFRFGYYIPEPAGAVVIQGEAQRENGCVVGIGSHTTRPLVPGQTTSSDTVLRIEPVREHRCDGAANPNPSSGLVAGQVFDGPPPDDLDLQNNAATMTVHWSGFGGSVTGHEYKIASASDCEGPPVFGPVSLDKVNTHTAVGLTLSQGRVFNCVRGVDAAGKFSAWAASDGVTIDLEPPVVVEYRPAALAKTLERKGPITVVFSEALDPKSLSADSVLLSALGNVVPAMLELDADGKTLALRPEKPLPFLAPVTVTVTVAARDLAGNPLRAGASASFTTQDGQWITRDVLQTQDRNDLDRLNWELGLALAAEPGGRSIVAWEEAASANLTNTRLHAFRYDPAVGWSASQSLDTRRPTRARAPKVAVSRRGDVTIVYSQDVAPPSDFPAHIFMFQYDAGVNRSWGTRPSANLASRDDGLATVPHAAYAMTGEMLATWTLIDPKTNTGQIEARRCEGHLLCQAPDQIDQPRMPGDPAVMLREAGKVAFDRTGNAHVAWLQETSAEREVEPIVGSIWTSRYLPTTGWGAPSKISGAPSGRIVWLPEIAVDDKGNAVVVWSQIGAVELVFAAHYSAGEGKWGPALAGSSAKATVPRVAMNAAGDAIALWNSGATGITVRRLTPSGWAENVRTRTEALYALDVGIDDRSLATVLWREGAYSGPTSKVLVARETADGGLGEPLQLNKDPAYGLARLAVLPDGRAFVTWVESQPLKLFVARFE